MLPNKKMTQAPAKAGGKKAAKKPVSAKQAAALANFLKNKKAPKAPVDAEDLIDGGADEAQEKN